jgi:hypothetical protein
MYGEGTGLPKPGVCGALGNGAVMGEGLFTLTLPGRAGADPMFAGASFHPPGSLFGGARRGGGVMPAGGGGAGIPPIPAGGGAIPPGPPRRWGGCARLLAGGAYALFVGGGA